MKDKIRLKALYCESEGRVKINKCFENIKLPDGAEIHGVLDDLVVVGSVCLSDGSVKWPTVLVRHQS